MSGYLDNPAANRASFVDGWFRTGDQGHFDDDGYLTITGRLKELINRGGEKVAPREIDIALLEHPDVVEAVAFAMPHDRLGEEVGAAVVLRRRRGRDDSTTPLFVGERLAPYKVPRRVVVVDALPDEAGRARSSVRTWPRPWGSTDPRPSASRRQVHVEATDDVERELCSIWQRVLSLDAPPSTDREFLESRRFAARHRVADRRRGGVRPTSFPRPSSSLARRCRTMAEGLRGPATSRRGASVYPVRAGGSKPPLFCLVRSGAVITVRHLAAAVGPDQPVYALVVPTMHGPPDSAGLPGGDRSRVRGRHPRGPARRTALPVRSLPRCDRRVRGGAATRGPRGRDRARRARRRSSSTSWSRIRGSSSPGACGLGSRGWRVDKDPRSSRGGFTGLLGRGDPVGPPPRTPCTSLAPTFPRTTPRRWHENGPTSPGPRPGPS